VTQHSVQNAIQPQPQPRHKDRTRSRLNAALEKNLSTYAIAAGSAGVALLACVQPSEAKVVVTKTNIAVPINGGLVQFDINGDGQMDFGLSAKAFPTSTCTFTDGRPKHGKNSRPLGCPFDDRLHVVPAQTANEIWQAGTSYGTQCAADLGRGVRIDRFRPFAPGVMAMYVNSGTSEGHQFCRWQGGTPPKPYLGVKFLDTDGNLHYGWVRVTNEGISATINGYAYETIPNKPILAGAIAEAGDSTLLAPSDLAPLAPEPATLGRLAQGAPGLAAWRREDDLLAA
jgi:hypothetical protein